MQSDENIVQKPRQLFEDTILAQNADALAKFMDEPLTAIAETITGALAAGPQAWMVMSGRIVQAVFKAKLFQQVSREIKELREKGKLPDDFAEKPYGFDSWVELFRVIDEEAPNAEKLKAVKAMFYSVNRIDVSDSERVLNYQLFQIAKNLTSGELLLLKIIYGEYKSKAYPSGTHTSIEGWAKRIADKCGHKLVALVQRDERALVSQNLISGYINPGQHNAMVNDYNARMTDLGILFCENIQRYEIEVLTETEVAE